MVLVVVEVCESVEVAVVVLVWLSVVVAVVVEVAVAEFNKSILISTNYKSTECEEENFTCSSRSL